MPRKCQYILCKKEFEPSREDMRYHSGTCEVRASFLRKIQITEEDLKSGAAPLDSEGKVSFAAICQHLRDNGLMNTASPKQGDTQL